jgi:hypothetical protein
MLKLFKATIWSGAGWLLALCVILTFVITSYFLLHLHYKGTDHKKLDATELTNLDNVLAAYPDPSLKGVTDTIEKIATQRENRNQLIFNFLKNEFGCNIDSCCLKQLDELLCGLNNKDAKLYLSNHDIIVNDFFWFVGPRTYLEVLMWALIGVLTSLIYYVSLANKTAVKRTKIKQAEDSDIIVKQADTGMFDVSKISVQVAKMFYAPVCALVLVLGYNLLNTDSKMTDISIGKGLILFSFICGFFSGRVIKFIDKLKELILPVSDEDGDTPSDPKTPTGGKTPDPKNPLVGSSITKPGDNKTPGSTDDPDANKTSATTDNTPKTDSIDISKAPITPAETTGTSTEIAVVTKPDAAAETAQIPAVTTADITVNLQLSPAASQSADGPDIIEGGFNSAVVTLQAAEGGNVITLTPPADDQAGSFTTKDLPLGKYTLLATMAYKKDNSIINLSASQTVAISNATDSIDLLLDITSANG